jgi:hypothetical protein
MVVVCDSDGNVTQTVLDILQQSADCEESIAFSDDNMAETLVHVLEKYQHKLILITLPEITSILKGKLRNISYHDDNCDISDLDEKSQKQILERPVNFQGTSVALSTLLGTDASEDTKPLLDSDVLSVLLKKEHELSIGRQLGAFPKYYVPRVLQHEIYLKKDILKLTDKTITFAVSGLQADELKNYLPAGEKMYEIVYDEKERKHTFKIFSDFCRIGLGDKYGRSKALEKV